MDILSYLIGKKSGDSSQKTLNPIVPSMTAASFGGFTVTASSYFNNSINYQPYRAFNGAQVESTMQQGWLAASNDNAPWIQVIFDKLYALSLLRIYTANNQASASKTVAIKGLRNDVWEDIIEPVTLDFEKGTYGDTCKLYQLQLNGQEYEGLRIEGNEPFFYGNNKTACTFSEVQVYYGATARTLIPKTITRNGIYNAVDDNADGYSRIVANVSGSGSWGIPTSVAVTSSPSIHTTSPRKSIEGIFGNIKNNFVGLSGRSGWINLKFEAFITLKKIRLSNYFKVDESGSYSSSNITVRASNDNFATYDELYVGTNLEHYAEQFDIDLNNSTAYTDYRFILSDNDVYIGLGRIELYD